MFNKKNLDLDNKDIEHENKTIFMFKGFSYAKNHIKRKKI